MRLCGISSRFQLLSPSEGQVAHALLTRPPLTYYDLWRISVRSSPFDLHVLGTPPAFILSQDQTLMFKFVRSKSVWLILPFYCCFRFLFSEISLRTFLFCLEFSGLHYCLFVKVPFFLLEVFPEELSFLSLRQLIDFIISSSVCQELFSFYFQVSFETWLLITCSNSSVVYQNFLFVSSSFFIFFLKMITAAFTVGLQYSILPFPCQ